MTLLRFVGGFLLAAVIAVAIIVGFIYLNFLLWPFPADLDPRATDPETLAAIAAYTETLPLAPKINMLAGYSAAMLMGGLIAGLVSRSFLVIGLVFGGLFTLFAFITVTGIPMALWLKVLNVGLMLPLALLGSRIGSSIGR